MNHRERMRRREKKGQAEQFAAGNFQIRLPINLRIDELVLNGSAFAAPQVIADTVQRGLTQMINATGLPHNSSDAGHREHVNGGVISFHQGIRAGRFGNDIARSVYRALKGSDRA